MERKFLAAPFLSYYMVGTTIGREFEYSEFDEQYKAQFVLTRGCVYCIIQDVGKWVEGIFEGYTNKNLPGRMKEVMQENSIAFNEETASFYIKHRVS